MNIYPTSEEIELAADLLINKYRISANLLGQLFGTNQRDQASSIIQSLGGSRLKAIDVARLLIQKEGPELFVGSSRNTRELRQCILKHLPEDKIIEMYTSQNLNTRITTPSRMIKPLVEMRWHSGKKWANDFIVATGFPKIFAGIEKVEKVPSIIKVKPRTSIPKLVDFQISLKEQMLEVLEQNGNRTKCIVTLPTGGGKTRVAVEAFIDWMQPRFSERKYMLWIAQSEELCEQAIACIVHMWEEREFVEELRIYRYFGGRELTYPDDLVGGAVVASIQQLHNRIKTNDPALIEILENTGAMIIDEAHRATSEMYKELFDKVEDFCGKDNFPICGLTATPGRSGINSKEETNRLVGRFDAYLIKPDLGEEYKKNPLKFFRLHEYLAKANHIVYDSGREFTLTDEELDEMPIEQDLPPKFLKRLANDKKRNLLIISKLLELPKDTSTIVYACTVDHAFFLTAILNSRGRKAGAVSADTPITLRRALINDFKNKKIEFLCNFGVLTTGFDAPKTNCIAMCRPTTSEVLYEQIIGRGLRGIKFNGTTECKIIDFADNIYRLGPPLAYARFEGFWDKEEKE